MATRRRGEERKYTEGWEEMKGGRKERDNRRSQGGMGLRGGRSHLQHQEHAHNDRHNTFLFPFLILISHRF